MALDGTGYIVGVDIESHKGTMMRDLDFTLQFYVQRNRYIQLNKSDLIHINKKEEGDLYFAMVDSSLLGPGVLRCCITIKDNEPRWMNNGMRPVKLDYATGIVIGSRGDAVRHAMAYAQPQYDEGFRVSFNHVWGIPKAEAAYIFYGHLINKITNYAEITPDMLIDPSNYIQQVSAGQLGKTSCGVMEEGDKVVVLIPVDYNYVATKDNGFGGKMAFNEMILGANGGPTIELDGVLYRVYGEMMTTEGEMFIYVN